MLVMLAAIDSRHAVGWDWRLGAAAASLANFFLFVILVGVFSRRCDLLGLFLATVLCILSLLFATAAQVC